VALQWNIVAWIAWGILITGFRYSIERRQQIVEQDAALRALETSLEVIS